MTARLPNCARAGLARSGAWSVRLRYPVFLLSARPVLGYGHASPVPSAESAPMRPGYRRAALGLFLLLILIGLVSSPTTSDALAQRKGGGGQKDGRAREKDTPPPNLTLPDSWAKAFSWRNIGPANMGGRITAIAVHEADPSTYWIATASGGLVKTTNNGVTFEHQFDHEGTVSIGDVCVAPSDRNVVWVGTGENN